MCTSDSLSPPTRIVSNPSNTSIPSSTSWLNQLAVNHILFTPLIRISSLSNPLSSILRSSHSTSCPPFSSIPQYSKVVASNDGDPVDNHTSPDPSFINPPPFTKLMILPCSTITPFGRPVDPDVYITYARSFDDSVVSTALTASLPISSHPPSSNTTFRPPPLTFSPHPSLLNTISDPISDSMYPIRSCGYSGSIGTYAPPAFNIPSIPTISSTDRSMHTGTSTPSRTPSPRK